MNIQKLFVIFLILVGISAPVWAIFCPGCGFKAADEDQFCRQCGKQLTEVVSVPPVNQVNPAAGPVVGVSPGVIVANPTPRAFQVTSNYLLVNGIRLLKNSFFWVAEVNGPQARIWSVDGPPYDNLIMGWVSLAELDKRSTLKTGTMLSCVEPPPPTTKVVVIERTNFWRHWGPRSFYFGSHRGGHHHH